jgi:hypothetical protein
MPVGNEEEAGIAILQLHPVLHRSEVIAEVNAAGWPKAAEDVLLGWIQSRARAQSEKDGAV